MKRALEQSQGNVEELPSELAKKWQRISISESAVSSIYKGIRCLIFKRVLESECVLLPCCGHIKTCSHCIREWLTTESQTHPQCQAAMEITTVKSLPQVQLIISLLQTLGKEKDVIEI